MTECAKILVVDLDGTLCDSAHREHLARAKQWDEFHSKLLDDSFHADVAHFIKMAANHCSEVLLLTGRNEKYRALTYRWLERSTLPHCVDDLLMRPDNDYRPDTELKPQLLDGWIDTHPHYTHSDIWLILEDREKVVDNWRDLGYNCWQVRPGGY